MHIHQDLDLVEASTHPAKLETTPLPTIPSVMYLNKKDKLPYYQGGKELHIVEYDRGWVEYLLPTSDLYFCKLNQALLNRFHGNANAAIRMAWQFIVTKEDPARGNHQLAMVKHLVDVRSQQSFDLPLFVDWNQPGSFSCGNNRFTAEMLCGTEADIIPTFFLVKKGQHPRELEQATPIYSTQQAEQISNIEHTEYKLTLSRTQRPLVISTMLGKALYDDRDYFNTSGQLIADFWKRFLINDKIAVRITCNEDIKDLINFNRTFWEVDFDFKPMLGFNFGEILAQFNKPDYKGLNLYVYDIKEPLYLSYLLPFGHAHNVWYHTLNKKIHLFDTTQGPSSACRPIIAMSDFVK
jgi:hypothetical protein